MPVHLPQSEFERLAREALASLPEEFRRCLPGMELRIQDYPEDDLMVEWGLRPPHYPFGMYDGPSIAETTGSRRRLEGTMVLYKRPLEEWCRDRNELHDQIERTVYHELGHRLGFEEDDMPEPVAPGAGMPLECDPAAEAPRYQEQAQSDLAAARATLEAGCFDWALSAALAAAQTAAEAFLLRNGDDPLELGLESLAQVLDAAAEVDPELADFEDLIRLDEINPEMGEEGVPPPCRRIDRARAERAVARVAALIERLADRPESSTSAANGGS